jgi:thiamine-phosphate pyrophosphorylase
VKPAARRAALDLVAASRGLPVKLVGIGGIDASNAGAAIAAGCDAVAVISAVFDAPDVREAARAIAHACDQARADAARHAHAGAGGAGRNDP